MVSLHRHPIAGSTHHDQLSRLPLDHALIDRLKASYRQVRAGGLELGLIFYRRLFATAPQLRVLFHDNPDLQAQKLIASLDTIVLNLTQPNENAAMLADLGRRHVEFGAKPDHYDLVTRTLVDSIQEVLGAQADKRILDEWQMAIRLVSNQMIAAAHATGRHET